MRRWWWMIGWLWWLVCAAPGHPVQAVGAGFTVTPQLPANQLDRAAGFFDLRVTPGVAQPLTVVVANRTATAKRLQAQVVTAYTQVNGVVSYAPGAPRDDSAQVRLSEIASKPVTFTLAAHQARPVTMTVVPPASGFTGQVLGALIVQDRSTYAAGGSAAGFGVRNQFTLAVAVQLQVSLTKVAPHLRLGPVRLGTQATRPAVLAQVQNDRPRLFGQLALTATITPTSGGPAVARRQVHDYAMAPNSHFDFAVWPAQDLAPGRYWFTLTATAGQATWRFRRAFTVGQTLSSQAQAAGRQRLWAAGWLAVLTLALVLWLGWRRRKRRGLGA
ncbi:DUF916 and DUF3324 domain-containing protein [Lacticaseibacillus absianus]|uniref:DUF916 and DUF3324 domain-containing protein n=1 Tax=Lacticaseibacillus absianus TaxID=2729623 RepID=UPI0015CA678D|nr:DUF916 and DUF3324 domain-containing protein [Lacticaseibacillus absianus]